jgi:hypothetical protein
LPVQLHCLIFALGGATYQNCASLDAQCHKKNPISPLYCIIDLPQPPILSISPLRSRVPSPNLYWKACGASVVGAGLTQGCRPQRNVTPSKIIFPVIVHTPLCDSHISPLTSPKTTERQKYNERLQQSTTGGLEGWAAEEEGKPCKATLQQ